MAKRIVFILGVLSLVLLGVALRGIYLQVLPNERLEHRKGRLFQKTVTLDSRRGDILDRNGQELAVSVPSFSLYADPKLIEDTRGVAKKLAKICDLPIDPLLKKLKNKNSRFFWVKRRLSESEHEAVKLLKVRGLGFKEESKRIYPNGQLASHILGYVGREGNGLIGVENKFEKHLNGNTKRLSIQKDARGRPLIENGWMVMKRPDGNDLILTIDRDVQFALEQELSAVVTEQNADSAVGVILDAQTSAVVAMANSPGFDPNSPQTASPDHQRNRAVSDSFEPGSTMKTFLVSGVLRDQVYQPNSKIDTGEGELKIGKRIISESDKSHKFGIITLAEVLAKSSNVGTSKIAMKYGGDRLKKTLMDFGFGQNTGIQDQFPGEAKGLLLKSPWSVHTLTSASFGHSLSVTPLQMANAYAAIANGGELKRPFIVKSLRNNETGEIEETSPKVIRRVLSKVEAQKVTMMLTMATGVDGTGSNARISGFSVAGKTGTAQKVSPDGKGYLDGAYVSSFAGYFPAGDPKYVIFVAVDYPKKSYYGAQVAAPLFSKMARYLVRKQGISPVILTQDALGLRKEKDKSKAMLTTVQNSEGPQNPEKSTDPVVNGSLEPLMPELKGISLREVIQIFRGQKIKVEFKGKGRVTKTLPEAGAVLEPQSKVQVILSEQK